MPSPLPNGKLGGDVVDILAVIADLKLDLVLLEAAACFIQDRLMVGCKVRQRLGILVQILHLEIFVCSCQAGKPRDKSHTLRPLLLLATNLKTLSKTLLRSMERSPVDNIKDSPGPGSLRGSRYISGSCLSAGMPMSTTSLVDLPRFTA